MVVGENGLVGLTVTLLAEAAHVQEQEIVMTQLHRMTETTVLEILLNPPAAILTIAPVS